MSSSSNKEYEESRRLLVRGIASARAKENQPAKRMLERILRLPATSEQKADAYYWLSEIDETPKEKREHLELALGHNPAHHLARKKLAIFDGKLVESEIINPDKFKPNKPNSPLRVEGKRHVCGNCGGRLTYTPDGSSLICEQCESRKRAKSGGKLEESDFLVGASTTAGHQKPQATQLFECKACGAKFLLSPETISLSCPHCDSNYSIAEAETRLLVPPEGIIPFGVSRNDINRILSAWLKDSGISKTPHIETFSGVYLPVWTFDIGGFIKWTGDVYENDNYMKWSEQKHVFFDDLLIPASKQLPIKFGKLLNGYCPADIVPFSPDYTANWFAETYSVSMTDAAIEARSVAYQEGKIYLSQKEDLSKVSNLTFSSTGLVVNSYKLILVPAWMGKYVFSGTQYLVSINGKSGEIFGQLPPTRLEKLSKWFLGGE